jgi:hypothetical protein
MGSDFNSTSHHIISGDIAALQGVDYSIPFPTMLTFVTGTTSLCSTLTILGRGSAERRVLTFTATLERGPSLIPRPSVEIFIVDSDCEFSQARWAIKFCVFFCKTAVQ